MADSLTFFSVQMELKKNHCELFDRLNFKKKNVNIFQTI